MSLIGALNIGKTALATHQASIQVTGNNIANAGNADYTRQVGHVTPNRDQQIRQGLFVGTGINLSSVQRQVDEALQARLRGSVSDNAAADTMLQWLGRIEAVFNELSEQDLSTQLSHFFNAWSELANRPQDPALRQVVLQTGQAVAQWLQTMRQDLGYIQQDADARLAGLVHDADRLAEQVADLNQQIVLAEAGSGGQANGLRDQRDAVLRQLSELMGIRTVPQENGVVDVYVGSEPLVIGTQSRGVGLRQDVVDGQLRSTVIFKATNGAMRIGGGQLGAVAEVRLKHIDGVIDQIDQLAGGLIFELNKLHASGQGLEGFSSTTSSNAVADPSVALGDPQRGLAFMPADGSFVVQVKDQATGLIGSTLVTVDPQATTLDSLAAMLDGIDNVSASVSAGRLSVTAAGGREISFSQDSSGTLAALGINTFFTGTDARDIAVSQALLQRPALLAAAKNGAAGDNQTALAIAALESRALSSLGGTSLKDAYQGMINGVAVTTAGAKNHAEAARIVRETLEAQREALSGVSLDEEAINLMRQQRAFQGAARLVAAVDEMMRTVLNLV